jgi:hypothetical protein
MKRVSKAKLAKSSRQLDYFVPETTLLLDPLTFFPHTAALLMQVVIAPNE